MLSLFQHFQRRGLRSEDILDCWSMEETFVVHQQNRSPHKFSTAVDADIACRENELGQCGQFSGLTAFFVSPIALSLRATRSLGYIVTHPHILAVFSWRQQVLRLR